MDCFDFSKTFPGVNITAGICDVHGEYRTATREIDQPKCPHCLQSRIEREAREAHDLQRVAHLAKISNIPGRYADAGLNGFVCSTEDQSAALKRVSGWVRHQRADRSNLVLTGGVGTGKTHLVCAAVRNLIHDGISCRYETAASLLAEIKKSYSDNDKTESGQIDSYTDRYQILVIDEADVTRSTDNDLGLLFAVINGRYNAMRSLVVVSNQSVSAMPSWLGERAADRVMEGATVVACNWKSYRSKAA